MVGNEIDRKTSKKSKYTGVLWCSERKKWKTELCIHNKRISLGRHLTEEAAAIAFDNAANKLITRLTNTLNFPDRSNVETAAVFDEEMEKGDKGRYVPDDDHFFGPSTELGLAAAREGEVDIEDKEQDDESTD